MSETPRTRVVSLLPAATEVVFALGCGDRLVGVSHECDFPAEARKLRVVTRARFDSSGSSLDIDRSVRRAFAAGQALYELDLEALRDVGPDLVLAQDQCAVCALPAVDVEATACSLGLSIKVVRLHAHDFPSVFADIERVAVALGCPRAGRTLVEKLEQEVETIRRISARARYRPRVLCLEWLDPPMVAGNWVPTMVEIAGGIPLLARAGVRSSVVSWQDVVDAAPEVVVLMPCGFPLQRTLAELDGLRSRPEWKSLIAVEHGRVYIVDGNAYFNRPGPRIVRSLQVLAGLVQPSLCARWLPEDGWARLPT